MADRRQNASGGKARLAGPEASGNVMARNNPDRPASRWLMALLVAGGILILLAGYRHLQQLQKLVRQQAYANLSALVQLKVLAVSNWYQERQGDAAGVLSTYAAFPGFQKALRNCGSGAPVNPAIQRWLRQLQHEYNYESVTLFDAEGKMCMALPETILPPKAHETAEIQAALQSSRIISTDLHRSDAAAPCLELFVPLRSAGAASARSDGLIRLRIDPRRQLFPILQGQPLAGSSIATLWCRREGNALMWVNPPDLPTTNAEPRVALPLTQTNRVPVQAEQGQAGPLVGADYRGVPVVAAAASVPVLSGILLCQRDLAEIEQPLRRQFFINGGFVGLLLLVAFYQVHLLYRQRRQGLEQRQRESEARYQEIFEYSPIAIWDEDFSAVKHQLMELRAGGVTDLAVHLAAHPEVVRELATRVRVIRVNQAALKLLGLTQMEDLFQQLPRFFTEESYVLFQQELVALAGGERHFRGESVICNAAGEKRLWEITLAVPLGYEDSLARVLVSSVDITERRQMKEQLREREKMLTYLVNSLPVAIASWSGSQKVMDFLNPTFTRWFGYTLEDVPTVDHWWPLAYPDPAVRAKITATWQERVERALATRQPMEPMETQVTCKDGSSRMIEWGFIPIQDHGYAVGLDLTAFRRSEKEIQRVSRLYAVLSQISQHILRVQSPAELYAAGCRMIVSAGGFKLAWIGQVQPLYGRMEVLTQAGEVGNYLDRVRIYLNDRPEGSGPTATCIHQNRPYVCNDFHQDPITMPWREMAREAGLKSSLSVPLNMGAGRRGALVVYSDEINYFGSQEVALVVEVAQCMVFAREYLEHEQQRKLAEAESTLHRQRLSFLLSTSPAMIYSAQATGDYGCTFISENIRELTGYTAQEFMADSGFWAKHLHPDDAPRIFAEVPALFTQGHHHHEYRFRFQDGSYHWMRDELRLVRDKAGNPVEIVGYWSDITAERNLQQQLRAVQKMEAFGQLAGGVAHDYNNILAAMLIQVELLLARTDLTPPIQRAAQALLRGLQRSITLTRQLLLFGRGQSLCLQPVELHQLVQEAMTLVRSLLGEQIEVQLPPATGSAWVEADAGMLEQVVMNLCLNARDAMPEGGQLTIAIEPEVSKEPGELKNPLARRGRYLALSVMDQGCGMDAETQARIFEPFFTTKDVGQGTGLGLATVHGIVTQHKGWIEVQSAPGQGSTFRIWLPARPAAAANPAPVAEPVPRIPTGRETILVVEDEAELSKMVSEGLTQAGYQIFAVATGAAALENWHDRLAEVDLLLTDIVMPGGINGVALAEAFQKIKPGLPVLLMSGYHAESAKAGRLTGEGIHHLAKPFSITDLAATVRTALDRAHGKIIPPG